MPSFSVILATRDRPGLFGNALQSVLNQRYTDIEIIIVDDGSSEASRIEYAAAIEAAVTSRNGSRIRTFSLPRRTNGHGQAYALNFGVAQAQGDYVCFLDDDDEWTDDEHLARAASVIARASAERGEPLGLYLANQRAYRDGVSVQGPVWLEGLATQLRARSVQPHPDGSFEVDLADLLQAGGFCHVNCLVVRRDLYQSVGGMDEGIRWECDHDLILRLLDRVGHAVHHPAYVSRHNVPVSGKDQSMTTSVSALEKRLFQLRVFDKALLFAREPAIRSYGLGGKVFTLKKIASELARSKRWRAASRYSREALALRPSPKWMGFTLYCTMRALAARQS